MDFSGDVLLRRYSLYLVAFLLLLLIWQQLGMLNAQPAFPYDDAYITLQNAKELLGAESAYADGSRLTGATSIVHTLIVTLILAIGSPELLALSLSSFFGAWLYLLGVIELSRCLSDKFVVRAAALVIAGFIAVSHHQFTNGLETSWAMAAVVWAACLYYRNTANASKALFVLLGILPFVRPELIALSGLLGALLIYRRWRQTPVFGTVLGFAAAGLGLASAGALPFLLFLYVQTGAIVPNTIAAKKYFFAEACNDPAWKNQIFSTNVRFLLNPLPLMLICLIGLFRDAFGRIALLFIALFYYAYMSEFPGALGHYDGRYQYILVPLALVGGLLLLRDLSQLRWGWVSPLAAISAAAVVVFINFPEGIRLAQARESVVRTHLLPIADWLDSNVQSGDTLLVHDAGYVGYVAKDVELVDIVGLKNPDLISFHEELTWSSCGQGRFLAMAKIFSMTQPDYVVVLNGWDQIYGITSAIIKTGARLELRYSTAEPGVSTAYAIYAVEDD